MDHSLFRRQTFDPSDIGGLESDIFISSFSPSLRVTGTFDKVRATRKLWIVHSEYDSLELGMPPNGETFVADASAAEVETWLAIGSKLGLDQARQDTRVIVDITGMLTPYLLVMPIVLANYGVKNVDVVYSEPVSYVSGSQTVFSTGGVASVRQVQGFEGVHTRTADSDSLIIAAGYDDYLVRAVAESKRTCQHYVMLGLPSLRPHMYQESQLRLAGAVESLNRFGEGSLVFAPANDPFATASVLQEHARRHDDRHGPGNRYLCPLSTKSQALGFSWFYLTEARSSATSMIYPFGRRYRPDTSVGVARTHVFTLELDCLLAAP